MKNFLSLIILFMLQSCITLDNKPQESELPGKYYRIKEGDTLELIARKYRISIDEIMETNGIENPRALHIGQTIFLPDPDPIGTKIAKLIKSKENKVISPAKEKETSAKIMDFPVPGGKIFREFSRDKKNPYDGIGIKANQGETIVAALRGKVIFVGDDGTKFGLIVIIEHEKNLITVYTHLDKALVSTGQEVQSKTPLGLVGTSGGVSFPRLHFQVRHKQRPKDPRLYLKGI
jgi:lipoprotein NlpD